MGAQHKQKNAVDVESSHTATPSAGGKILFLKIFDSSTYSGLFKAGTVCFTIWLIGASQTAVTLYDKEIDAYSDKYKFEAATHRFLDQTDCRLLSNYQADCFLAKHKIKASGSALETLKTATDAAWLGGIFFFIASTLLFFFAPFALNAYKKTSR
ncbi:hypothetical protein [Pseudomonas sp. NPDC086278]|uniref:hypothetical protein n=1 Tax=Pseudomonas sp. NPDC086278 TaxID=3390646 RepID=UPI003CFC0EB3